MEKTINYYIVQTEEDKEFFVQNKIRSLFKFETIIPTEELIISINGRKFAYHSRLMPDYLFIGTERLSSNHIDIISKIKGVLQVMTESSSSGPTPYILQKDEVSRFINRPDKKVNEFITLENGVGLGKKINIISGQYAGYEAIVQSIGEDKSLTVTVSSGSKPKVKIPIWFVGKEVEKVIV